MMLCTKETLDYCSRLAVEAGKKILAFQPKDVGVSLKTDASPVTEADMAAHGHIRAGLLTQFPAIPIISEEDESFSDEAKEYFWLIDPLDGTKGFIRGEKEYTVNIALIHHGEPVLGVIYTPAKEELYVGARGLGAWKGSAAPVPLHVNHWREGGVVAVLSRFHGSSRALEALSQYDITEMLQVNSSYKFCMVAEGRAHLYPRIGPTMEWDTAAGQAIVEAAGGTMVTWEGAPFRYGKPGYANPGFLVKCEGL